jgi:AcrR family transcriptional regulator
MSKVKKRSYYSAFRSARATQTRSRILIVAKHLFESDGFECVTIERIAQTAQVSIPTVYALFQSKRGLLRSLMDEVFPKNQFDALVKKSCEEASPKKRLLYSARIARQLYDAEREQMKIFQGAGILAPEFKELEKEREMRRYSRQETTIQAMVKEGSLSKDLNLNKARDILWALTGRDMYRMLVVEKGWMPEEYESYLAQLLASFLIEKNWKALI